MHILNSERTHQDPKLKNNWGLIFFQLRVTVTGISTKHLINAPQNHQKCPKMHILNLGRTHIDLKLKNVPELLFLGRKMQWQNSKRDFLPKIQEANFRFQLPHTLYVIQGVPKKTSLLNFLVNTNSGQIWAF